MIHYCELLVTLTPYSKLMCRLSQPGAFEIFRRGVLLREESWQVLALLGQVSEKHIIDTLMRTVCL
jgi:hypothetical protein